MTLISVAGSVGIEPVPIISKLSKKFRLTQMDELRRVELLSHSLGVEPPCRHHTEYLRSLCFGPQ